MSQDETSSIVPDDRTSIHSAILQRGSMVNFENIRPSTPPLHKNDTAPLLSQQSSSDQMVSTISLWTKFGFGLGHVYNDLCAAVWFSYILLFLTGAMRISGTAASGMMMLGQVGDAIATPIIGILVDKYGTKQKWHIFGTFLVFLTFPMIYSVCPFCDVWPSWWQFVYFSIVIILFQIAWPIVQVSHLAIIPELARTQKDRTQLSSVRFSASVISGFIVYALTWVILEIDSSSSKKNISPKDAYRFRDISLILTLIGLTMTAIFQFWLTFSGYGLRRSQALDNNRASLESRSSYRSFSEHIEPEQPITMRQTQQPQRRRKNFLKSAKMYQNSLLYVFAKLFSTTAMIYIPLWLNDRLKKADSMSDVRSNAGREHLAIIPMVSFVASFLSSLIMNRCHSIGLKSLYLIGSVLCIIGCLLIEDSTSVNLTSLRLYTLVCLLGAGSSITLISSLCFIANMIGKHADQSGFVYSVVTCADKLTTGVAVLLFQSLQCDEDRTTCPEYYKDVLARACGGAAILGIVTLSTLSFNCRRRSDRTI